MFSAIAGWNLSVIARRKVLSRAILFCSGHPETGLARMGIDIEGAQFMQKPCRPLQLKQRLSEMLAGAESFSEEI